LGKKNKTRIRCNFREGAEKEQRGGCFFAITFNATKEKGGKASSSEKKMVKKPVGAET